MCSDEPQITKFVLPTPPAIFFEAEEVGGTESAEQGAQAGMTRQVTCALAGTPAANHHRTTEAERPNGGRH
jgi:hypothetical protein